MTPAYFGPADGPGRQACLGLGLDGGTPFDDPVAALRAVSAGTHGVAVVPLEDSITGTRRDVVDHLVFETDDLVVIRGIDVTAEPVRTLRFVAVATADQAPGRPAGGDALQTLVFVVPALNRPGTWTEVFGSLSARGINVNRFDPRPLGGAVGMYGLLLEFEGDPGDPHVRDALADVLHFATAVKHLGTFPAERSWGHVVGRSPRGRLLTGVADLDGVWP